MSIKMDCNGCGKPIKGRFYVVGVWSGVLGKQAETREFVAELENVHNCEDCVKKHLESMGADFVGVARKLEEEKRKQEEEAKKAQEEAAKTVFVDSVNEAAKA